jgi:hypothetical protein
MKHVGEEEDEEEEEEDKWKVLDQVPTTSHLVKRKYCIGSTISSYLNWQCPAREYQSALRPCSPG